MSQLIMVIDDSVTVRKVIEVCLRRAGYAVISFPNGVKALRWLCSPGVRLPDLVFLDIGMPAMDGYAVAQYLRARPQYRQMVIVMISGRRGVLDRLKAPVHSRGCPRSLWHGPRPNPGTNGKRKV